MFSGPRALFRINEKMISKKYNCDYTYILTHTNIHTDHSFVSKLNIRKIEVTMFDIVLRNNDKGQREYNEAKKRITKCKTLESRYANRTVNTTHTYVHTN